MTFSGSGNGALEEDTFLDHVELHFCNDGSRCK